MFTKTRCPALPWRLREAQKNTINPSLEITRCRLRGEKSCSKAAITLQNGCKGVVTERRIPLKMLGAAVAVPLRPASAAETESTAQSRSRACLLVGRDALVAGCLDWALLTTAEVGWAPHMQAATERDVKMVSSKLFLRSLLFFIATVIFFIDSGLLT